MCVRGRNYGVIGQEEDKTPAAKSLYRSIFWIKTFGIAFYQSNISTGIAL
jgi:hypothetical protein